MVKLKISLGLLPGEPPEWGYLRSEVEVADEQLLLFIINHEKELILDETSPMPHRMSPESMLKLMAVSILMQKTGEKHIDLIDQLLAKAPPSLACGIKGLLDKWKKSSLR